MNNHNISPNEDLMRKIVVLRKALQKESEDRQKEFDELESLKKKLSILELTLSEKDTQIQINYLERERLESDVEKLSQSSNPSTPLQTQGISKSVAALEQQNKKLLDEYHQSKQQNTELKAKYDCLSQKHNEIKKQISAKDGHLKSVLEELKDNLDEATREKDLAEKDLEICKSTYFTLSDSHNKLQNEYQENIEKQKI
jgi:chromosome segregation ATPase